MDRRQRAKELRRNMTDAEHRLWYHLRAHRLGGKFRRQQPLGRYIVDFVHLGARLVVEADGGQHNGSDRDAARDAWLQANGYRVLRFATGDKTELSGWDESHYAASGYGDAKGTEQLACEFASSRNSNLALLGRLRSSAYDEIGVADGRKMSVRTIAWLMAGHWLHHEEILRKRLRGLRTL